MLTNKKAQITHVWKWLLYIPMTGIIVFIIMYIPIVIFGNATQTQFLENIVFAERVYNKMSIYDPLLFRVYPGHTCKGGCFDEKFIENSFDTSNSVRAMGFKLTYGDKSIFFNKEFYDDAKPLSPVRYDVFIEERPILVVDTNEVDTLIIDQVYSGRPNDFE